MRSGYGNAHRLIDFFIAYLLRAGSFCPSSFGCAATVDPANRAEPTAAVNANASRRSNAGVCSDMGSPCVSLLDRQVFLKPCRHLVLHFRQILVAGALVN